MVCAVLEVTASAVTVIGPKGRDVAVQPPQGASLLSARFYLGVREIVGRVLWEFEGVFADWYFGALPWQAGDGCGA